MRDFLGYSMIVATSVFAFFHAMQPAVVHFCSASDVQVLAMNRGYSIHDNNDHHNPLTCFFVSERPLDHGELSRIVRLQDCGLTPEWRGIVWVSQIRKNGNELGTSTIGGNTRVRGNVLFAGDVLLMDRLERGLANPGI